MEEVRFVMLAGIPASGKSTFSKELTEDRDDIVYLSSDEIREELLDDVNNQDNNGEVFNQMNLRALKALKDGLHVVFDATNISRKRRKGLLGQLPKNVKKIAVYFNTDYNTIIEQNSNRERVVPQHVIDRMYKNMQIPIYSEGWDEIILFHHDEIEVNMFDKQFSDMVRLGVLFGREGYGLMEFMASYFDEFFKIYDLPQDSSYHSFSVSRHTYYVYKYVLENYNTDNDNDKEVMLWTALLHDIGKSFCKSFYNRKGEKSKYANFIGHDNVSAQIAVSLLYRLGFDDKFIQKVATLIQFHMYLLDEKASRDKLINYVGEELYGKLEVLREADTLAH